MFTHVGNSLGELRRVQAAKLQGWTTGHVAAIFTLCENTTLSCERGSVSYITYTMFIFPLVSLF